jgi:hypothetical protein
MLVGVECVLALTTLYESRETQWSQKVQLAHVICGNQDADSTVLVEVKCCASVRYRKHV